MACEKFEELLHRHFDNALSASEEQELADHVRVCRRCRLDMKLYTWMFRAMETMSEVAPPLNFTRSVMEAIGRLPVFGASRRAGFTLRDLVWGLGVAALALAALGAGMVWYQGPAEPARLASLPLPAAMDDEGRATPESASTRSGELAPDGVKLLCDGPDVRIMLRGTRRWQRVDYQTVLAAGDCVTTPDRYGARLVYPDQTWIRLKPETTVQVLPEAIRVHYGDTWIKVEKRGTKFEALTPNAVASVRGTAYTAGVRLRPSVLGRGVGETVTRALLPGADMEATSVTARVVRSVLAGLVPSMQRATRSDFRVFESSVAVKALSPETGQVVATAILEEGQANAVADVQIARATSLQMNDYLAWNVPPNPALLHPEPVAAAVSAPAAAGTAAAEPTATDVNVRPSSTGTGPDFEALPKK